jgi:uncharacterized protein (DUF433 family)
MGRGIYDVAEIARITQRTPETITRWTSPGRGNQSFIRPETKGVYSFHDLISLHVISELRRRGVPKKQILNGIEYLTRELDTDRPFAHEALATVGSSFFAQIGSWVDVGLSGQAAFEEVVLPLLRPIEYGPDRLAKLWRPQEGVWIHPGIQAGTPCIDGTRVPTHEVARLVEAGEDADDVAADFDLTPEQVDDAVRWEHRQAA